MCVYSRGRGREGGGGGVVIAQKVNVDPVKLMLD